MASILLTQLNRICYPIIQNNFILLRIVLRLFWDICGYSDEGADLEGVHTLTKVMGKKSNNN